MEDRHVRNLLGLDGIPIAEIYTVCDQLFAGTGHDRPRPVTRSRFETFFVARHLGLLGASHLVHGKSLDGSHGAGGGDLRSALPPDLRHLCGGRGHETSVSPPFFRSRRFCRYSCNIIRAEGCSTGRHNPVQNDKRTHFNLPPGLSHHGKHCSCRRLVRINPRNVRCDWQSCIRRGQDYTEGLRNAFHTAEQLRTGLTL